MIVALFFLLHSPRDLREILRSPCLSYKAPVMQASNWSSFAVLERQKNEHRRQRQSHSSRNRAKTSSRKSPSPLAVSVSRQCWRISNACRKTGQHQLSKRAPSQASTAQPHSPQRPRTPYQQSSRPLTRASTKKK